MSQKCVLVERVSLQVLEDLRRAIREYNSDLAIRSAKKLIEEANKEFLADFTENEKRELRGLIFKLREKVSR